MSNASRDGNNIATLMGVSTVDGKTPIPVKVDAAGNLQTSASLTGGGGDGAILDGVSALVKATVLSLVSANPLTTAIVDGTGTQITSFGGGTQYATGATQATPTGTASLGWDGTAVRVLKTAIDGTLKTDASATTQPVSATALPLPTLAATSTKQSDGTQKTQVVDGSGNVISSTANALDINIKSGNPTSITANAGTNLNTSSLALDATLTGGTTKAIVRGGAKGTTTATDVTSSASGVNHQPLDVAIYDGSGNLKDPTAIRALTSSDQITVANTSLAITEADGANVTLGAKADAKNAATDTTAVSAISVLKQISASVQAPPSQAVTNTGTFATQSTLAAETTKVIGTVNQGTSPWVISFTSPQHVIADSGTITAVTAITNALPAGTNLLGKVGIDQTTPGTTNAVSLIPTTTGGWSKVKYAAQTTTVQTTKGTAGMFGGYFVYNPNSSVSYVQVFDVATGTSVTLGTTVPDMIFGIPATSGANLELVNGVNMANGIKLACTTTATGLTAPVTGLDMTIFYK